GDDQGQPLMAEHHDQAAVVPGDHPVEPARAQRLGLLALLALRPLSFVSWAHIIGTRVSDTTAEIRMVTDSVTANSLNSRPTTSPMNSSGISTAISDT